MPIAPGLAQLNTTYSAVFGSTSLTLGPPAGTVDDDILIMCLAHKGVGFATVPAGWTLVDRDVDAGTGIRGEMYWKRASSEPGSYSITGLADTAAGMIGGYRGGLLSGNVIDVSAKAVNGTNDATGPFTVTVPNAVIVAMTAAGDNNIITSSTGISAFPEIRTDSTVTTGNTAIGTDCGLGVKQAFMVVPGVIASARGGTTTSGNVTIAVALIPETAAATAGTRYYPTKRAPGTRIEDLAAGSWQHLYHVGMTAALMWPETIQLSQIKGGGGHLGNAGFSGNQTGIDILLARFLTPPLEAQTISGTVDLNFKTNSRFEDLILGNIAGGSIRYKVHIFITVGQTGQVRTILADNVVDSVDWTTSSTSVWQQLAAPLALATAACLAGDSVCVEFGARVVSISTPVPVYPPGDWNVTQVGSFGTAQDTSAIPFVDATPGTTTGNRVAWFDFSHTFVEQAPLAAPSNTTYLTAVEITAWPYVSPVIVTQSAQSPSRTVWYKFTGFEAARYTLTMLGSNYDTVPWIFNEAQVLAGQLGFSNQTPDLVQTASGGVDHGRCDEMAVFDMTPGQVYYIRIHCGLFTTAPVGGAGQSAGGILRLTLSRHEPLAEDDLFVPAANVYRLRDGVILTATPSLRSSATTGIALDYTRAPMADFNSPSYPAPTNTNERLLIALHDLTLVEIFDADSMNVGENEVGFFGSVFNSNGPSNPGLASLSTLSMTMAGRLFTAGWGNGYLYVNGSLSQANAAYYNADSDPVGLRWLRGISDLPAVVLDEQGAQALRADPYALAPGPIAPWHVQVADDEATAYYVAGGWYVDESQIAGVPTDIRADTIKRYNVSTDAQLADFATLPLESGAREGLYGLAVNPGGEVLVCNGPTVQRLNASGGIEQTYTFPVAKSRGLIDVVYTHDSVHFWVYDSPTATLFLVEVASGAIVQTVDTYFWARVTTQIVIYQPNGITPPPPECPGDRGDPRTDGLPYSPFDPDPCAGSGDRGAPRTGA